MRKLGRFIGRFLIIVVVLVGLIWAFGPSEPAVVDVEFDESQLEGGVDAYLLQVEAGIPNITPNTEKRVIWAGAPETKTPVSVVYIHGFSATLEEVRPVPDIVAAALGANLHYTRLEGHGRTPDDMIDATVEDWMTDVAEALAIGRAIGDEVLVISTSTGGTLFATAAVNEKMSAQVLGTVFISPNFKISNPTAELVTWPLARYWLPPLMNKTYNDDVFSEGHATYWTQSYSRMATFPLAAIVKHVADLDVSEVKFPALFYFSLDDKVVDPTKTEAVSATWGGVVTKEYVSGDDAEDLKSHVITGDIRSPSNTQPAVDSILKWVQTLGET